jgi:hypothetical protein
MRLVYYYSDERGHVYNSYEVDGKLEVERAVYSDNYHDKTYTPVRYKVGRPMNLQRTRYRHEVPWADCLDTSMAMRAHADGVPVELPFWRNILALDGEVLRHLNEIYKCGDYSEPPTASHLGTLEEMLRRWTPKGAPGG